MNKPTQHKPTQVVKPVAKPATQANPAQHDRERERQKDGGRNTEVKKQS